MASTTTSPKVADDQEVKPATPEPARRLLTLTKDVKRTLADSHLVRSKHGVQRHVLPDGETRTLCRMNTGS